MLRAKGEGSTTGVSARLRALAQGDGPWRVVGTNAASKVAVMIFSGLLGFITTRLIIGQFGVDAYAQYGLLTSMALLIPFADLGMSAALINTVASSKEPRTDQHVHRTLLSAFRVLLVSAGVLTSIAVLISVLQLWPFLLGDGLLPDGGVAALLCLVVFSVILPLGVGQRVLTGLGRNHQQIAIQALASPFFLGSVLLLVAIGGESGNFVAVASYLSGLLVAVVSLRLAARLLQPQVGHAIRDVPRIRTRPGAPILHVAWPMLAQMMALPLAMQTDRLLLSHLAGPGDLAQYNLASQLFGIILQTIGAAGIALWPVFARHRAAGSIRSPFGLAGGFAAGALALAVILAMLTPWLVPLLSGGKLVLSPLMIIGFVAFVTAQAAKYPLGMYMTDLPGLRFQVLPILILVPLNLGLSWLLIAPLGAAGPIVGSAIAVTVCQVVPNFWYVRRDIDRRRRSVGLDSGPSVTGTTADNG